MILAADVETSGLLVKDKPLDDPSQPRIVQIGYVVHNADRREVYTQRSLLQPDGWEIAREAQAVHGYSTEECRRYGVHPAIALISLAAMLDTVRILCMHNAGFDLRMIEREADLLPEPQRTQVRLRLQRSRLRRVCTMKTGTVLFADGKWPTLSALYRKLHGGDVIKEAHDALEDARATASCFWGLCDRRIIEL
jgi:DNA polymerase III subunit epsilon